MSTRRTIASSNNPAVLGGVKAKNNGRYNGNGRHWETPPEVFGPLDEEFNFTLDPCATPKTAKCPEFFTEQQNGLEQDWAGHRVFMNPPYGREVYAWTRKARLEQTKGVLVVGLLPASTDLAWWHEDVLEHAEVRYIRGRVRFLTGGPYRASGFFASVVTVWRPAYQPKEHRMAIPLDAMGIGPDDRKEAKCSCGTRPKGSCPECREYSAGCNHWPGQQRCAVCGMGYGPDERRT